MSTQRKKIPVIIVSIILAIGLAVGAVALSSVTLPHTMLLGDWKLEGSESDTPAFQFKPGNLVVINPTALASAELRTLVGAAPLPQVSSDIILAGEYNFSTNVWWSTPDKLGITFSLLGFETSVGFMVQVRATTLELTPIDGGATVSFERA